MQHALNLSFRNLVLSFVFTPVLFLGSAALAADEEVISSSASQTSPSSTSPTAPREVRRPRVGEIDASEKDRYRTRYESKNSTVFSFGPGFTNNLNSSKTLYALGFGYEWEVGAQNAVIAQLNGTFGDATAFIDGVIGGKYYFSDEDISPFVKAGFGFGSAKGSNLDAVGGFAASVGAGATVFRTSSTHLELGATFTSLFSSNARGNPSVTAITLGILF